LIELSELETPPDMPPSHSLSKPTDSAAPNAPPPEPAAPEPAAPEPTIAPPAESAEPLPMDDPPDRQSATRGLRSREQLETTDTSQT
jgi:hypothetical protein